VELDSAVLHIDPGPGASVRARECGFDLGRVQAMLVSHSHIDHMNDLPVLIAAITKGYRRRAGCLVLSERTLKDLASSTVLAHYLKTLKRIVPLNTGEQTRVGRVKIMAAEAKHYRGNVGFVLKGSKQVSYVSDTEYFAELRDWHEGSHVLVLNVVRPDNCDAPRQMNTRVAARLIGEVRPKLAIISHFGRSMRRPATEAKWIQSKTGVRVCAASDGLILTVR